MFFSKTAGTIFSVFGLKLVLNITFNLNKTYFSEKLQFGDIWPRNRQILASRPNYLTQKRLIHFFFFLVFISKVNIQLPLSYECNSFYLKLLFPRFLTLKMVTLKIWHFLYTWESLKCLFANLKWKLCYNTVVITIQRKP